MKPGYQTTEFWIAIAAAAIAGALGFLETVDAPWAVSAVTIISAVYSILRVVLKLKTPTPPAP